MSTDRDTTRLVRSWLDEGVTALPDRVLDAVLDQVPTTPQRRSWWPARRSTFMSAYAKLAIAAAAVLVVSVIGYNLMPRSDTSVGGKPTVAPTVAPTPTVGPTSSRIPALGSGPLEPGQYAWYWSGPRISFQVPAGWLGFNSGQSVVKNLEQRTEIGWDEWLPDSLPITHVYADACVSEGRLEPIGPTVNDLVQALSEQASSDVVVTDETIGTLPAKRVEIAQSASVDRSKCRYGSGGPHQIWADAAETGFYALRPGASGVVHVVDVAGARVVFTSSTGPDASASDVAELERMIESIQFATP